MAEPSDRVAAIVCELTNLGNGLAIHGDSLGVNICREAIVALRDTQEEIKRLRDTQEEIKRLRGVSSEL